MQNKPLSKREQAWLTRMQKALNACPTKRLGFFTIGDAEIVVYDRRYDDEIDDHGGDFCTGVSSANAELGSLRFPALVHSTSG